MGLVGRLLGSWAARFIGLVVVVALVVGASTAWAASSHTASVAKWASGSVSAIAPGQRLSPVGAGSPNAVVVVFDRGVRGARRAAIAAGAHTRAMRTLGNERFQLLAAKRGQSVHAAVAALRRAPGVEAADPNRTFTVADVPNVPNPLVPFVPNDPLFGDEWALQNTGQQVPGYLGTPATDRFAGTPVPGADIDATQAWDRTIGDPSTVVADIDRATSSRIPTSLTRCLGGTRCTTTAMPPMILECLGSATATRCRLPGCLWVPCWTLTGCTRRGYRGGGQQRDRGHRG